MDREKHFAERIKELSTDEIVRLHNEIASETGDFDYIEENGEDFFETYYYKKLDEMARAIFYGHYNYNEQYIRINTYGNLETTDYPVDEGWIDADDIAEWLTKNAESESFQDFAEELIETFYLEDDIDEED